MRSVYAIALLAVAVGCGGRAVSQSNSASTGAGANSGGAAGASVLITGSGGALLIDQPTTPSSGGSASIDAGPPTSDFGGSAGSATVIAGQPFCTDLAACTVTPADVVCNTDSDCRLLVMPSCNANRVVTGVNVWSMPPCVTPKCVTPPTEMFVSQDCKSTPDVSSVIVHCIAHRCTTSLAGCNPCDAK